MSIWSMDKTLSSFNELKHNRSQQRTDQRVLELTLKFETGFSFVKRYFLKILWPLFTFILCNFLVLTLQYFQKIFEFIFSLWKHKKRASTVAHNWPQTFFSQVLPGCANQPRIDFSYYTYVPKLICLLICRMKTLLF